MELADRAVGFLLSLISLSIFTYYTLWVVILVSFSLIISFPLGSVLTLFTNNFHLFLFTLSCSPLWTMITLSISTFSLRSLLYWYLCLLVWHFSASYVPLLGSWWLNQKRKRLESSTVSSLLPTRILDCLFLLLNLLIGSLHLSWMNNQLMLKQVQIMGGIALFPRLCDICIKVVHFNFLMDFICCLMFKSCSLCDICGILKKPHYGLNMICMVEL